MKIEIATLFPEMCEAVLGESIVGRARRAVRSTPATSRPMNTKLQSGRALAAASTKPYSLIFA